MGVGCGVAVAVGVGLAVGSGDAVAVAVAAAGTVGVAGATVAVAVGTASGATVAVCATVTGGAEEPPQATARASAKQAIGRRKRAANRIAGIVRHALPGGHAWLPRLTARERVRSVRGVSDSPTLDLAVQLWPGVRDGAPVSDPAALDTLLAAQGQPGAPGRDCGLTTTFACFAPGEAAALTLPSGERSRSDDEARFLGHLLVTRTLLAAGLAVDERVARASAATHALSWTTEGGAPYHQTPLALAVSLWLIALDPQARSDHPLPIDWSPACFERDWWDHEYRLFSHYDVRERALDWCAYASLDAARHEGCAGWTIAEPLLRMETDSRARMALPQLAAHAAVSATGDGEGKPLPAAAALERGRIALLVQGYLESTRPADDGSIRPADHHAR